jgi:hypothetical protein
MEDRTDDRHCCIGIGVPPDRQAAIFSFTQADDRRRAATGGTAWSPLAALRRDDGRRLWLESLQRVRRFISR